MEFYDPLEYPPEASSKPISHVPSLPESDSYPAMLLENSQPAKQKHKKGKILSKMFRKHKSPKENRIDLKSSSIGTFETRTMFSEQKENRSQTFSSHIRHQRSQSFEIYPKLSGGSGGSSDGKKSDADDDFVATLMNPSRTLHGLKQSQSFTQQSLRVPAPNMVSLCLTCVCVHSYSVPMYCITAY